MTSRTWTQRLREHDRLSRQAAIRVWLLGQQRWSRWIVAATYAGCLTAFIADLTSNNTLAFGVFYTPLVVTAVFHRDRRALWVLTTLACAMDILGAFFPNIPINTSELVGNRALSLCALLATAAFVRHARLVQDQLADQTNRAEAAERIKTDVLTNLSQEIREPLYAMIGVLELVAAGSRPDQVEALGMVRTSGRRLATTIDNLVDLTQFEDKPMAVETVDLGQLLRQTAETRLRDAASRQINMTIDVPTGEAMVTANSWAVRRILENQIADGISYTTPGGWIEVSTTRESGQVSAVIATSGSWPPREHLGEGDADLGPLTPAVMGLALSQRLARAMSARLVFSNGPGEGEGEGMIVRLLLPSVPRPQGV